MNTPDPMAIEQTSSPSIDGSGFTTEQKEYLEGLMAGIAQRNLYPYVGIVPETGAFTNDPALGDENLAEEKVYGVPISELCKQEVWKHELNGIDAWDTILKYSRDGDLPDDVDTFRLRAHGLFYVGPAQESFMLRCRIPAGILTSAQMRGLASLAEDYAEGSAAITTRANIQVRQINPKDLTHVLTRLADIGLTSKGSGVDNVRNITASPTTGFDRQELIDVRPYAFGVHHYILNNRDLYDLPRKFNISFESGGAIETVADTNDIGFEACKLEETEIAETLDNKAWPIEPGVYFRVQLCGITGHKQLAFDTGLMVAPEEAVAVSAAMLRVFIEHGDRTDRKKARLKYLVDDWGTERFLEETQKKLAFPLVKLPLDQVKRRKPPIPHGHYGVFKEKEAGKYYLGIVVPVGKITVKQMRRVADVAENYGCGELRLTPWQNVLIPGISESFLESAKRSLKRVGLSAEASQVAGGLVACTGNKGCKWSSADTKGHAVEIGKYLDARLSLDQPINIHLTGCPHSCAQHYIGDIGLLGAKVKDSTGDTVEGYHVILGGGIAENAAIGRQVFTGIPFSEILPLLERVLKTYIDRRDAGESFSAFTRRHEVKDLQELFSE